jgi:hypothetical protein
LGEGTGEKKLPKKLPASSGRKTTCIEALEAQPEKVMLGDRTRN